VREEIDNKIHYLDSMDTPVCEHSYEIALLAVGAGLSLCDAIIAGEASCGFANIRPPGHHAERTYASGFCIFNNIAITAKYLQQKHGIERIGIVDWDVHHGNGTQHAFEQDNSVFFISLHQFPHFPGSGSAMEKGRGDGVGYTMNLPFSPGSGDRDYIRQFQSKIVPALDRFQPHVILISAGYDGHRADPLSGIRLSSDSYYRFASMITDAAKKTARGRVIAFLEGGYNLAALRESAVKTIGAFIDS
jgi:acetoin utilization deacetylase AcuC-like enzyme